ncbi:MAG: hypothetical protein ACT4PU_06955 [Planctomycetota bacterium]
MNGGFAMVEGFVAVLAAYALAGLVFALVFVAIGVQRVDAGARSATWGFRLLILPGAAAFWPLLLMRWWRAVNAPATDSAR